LLPLVTLLKDLGHGACTLLSRLPAALLLAAYGRCDAEEILGMEVFLKVNLVWVNYCLEGRLSGWVTLSS